jgi:hypothetical protein
MKKIALISAVILLLAFPGWQIAACYVANSELQSDLKDLAVQNGARIGWLSVATEDELRSDVVARAKNDGISLEPQQIMVRLTMTPDVLSIDLAADYEARANLLVYSFPIHFAPSSSYSAKVIVK